MGIKKELSEESKEILLKILKVCFEKNTNRHESLRWIEIQVRLEDHPEKVWTLNKMEATCGEPDVVGYDKNTKEYIFYDCAAESPSGRRSCCYDREALDKRKENKPKNNALDFAKEIGIEILTEEQYRDLQKLGNFDNKTSSWIATPDPIRKLGGAIFADFRYGTVFIYHNGVVSYYAGRGFRCSLTI